MDWCKEKCLLTDEIQVNRRVVVRVIDWSVIRKIGSVAGSLRMWNACLMIT